MASPVYPTGYTQQMAIAMVRARTNLGYGQPPDATIISFLNAAVEVVQSELGQVIATHAYPITVPNTSTIQLDEDVERILEATYSTLPPTQAGAAIYAMDAVPYSEFAVLTDQVPVGGPGGIPAIYTILTDASNVLTMQVYPLVSSGQVNIRYAQRAQLFSTDTSQGTNSTTTLDSEFQEAMILWACARACEAREDMAVKAAYFNKLYEAEMERKMTRARKRHRQNNSVTVRDVVLELGTTRPFWT